MSSSGSGSEDEMLNDGRIVTVMPPPAPRAPDVPRVPPPLPPHGVQEIPIGSVRITIVILRTLHNGCFRCPKSASSFKLSQFGPRNTNIVQRNVRLIF